MADGKFRPSVRYVHLATFAAQAYGKPPFHRDPHAGEEGEYFILAGVDGDEVDPAARQELDAYLTPDYICGVLCCLQTLLDCLATDGFIRRGLYQVKVG